MNETKKQKKNITQRMIAIEQSNENKEFEQRQQCAIRMRSMSERTNLGSKGIAQMRKFWLYKSK